MTPERQAEIKEMIENVRKFGQVPHELLKAMDEMMATISALGEADYVLNVDATWKAKNKEISDLKEELAAKEDRLQKEILKYTKEIHDLRGTLRTALMHIREHDSEYHYVTPQEFKEWCEELLLRE